MNWKQEFKALLFPVNEEFSKLSYTIQKLKGMKDLRPSDFDIDKSMNLKLNNCPSFLYKYRSFDDKGYSIQNIKSNTIWLAEPISFNDPFDSKLHSHSIEFVDYMFDFVEIINSKLELTELKPKESKGNENPIYPILKMRKANEILKDFAFKNHVLLSNNESNSKFVDLHLEAISFIKEQMTKEEWESHCEVCKLMYNAKDLFKLKNEMPAYLYKVASVSEVKDSNLMWSHYAENHSGFCIEYSILDYDNFQDFIEDIYPVFYENTTTDETEDILKGIKFYKLYSVLRKSSEWQYEKEWRIVIPVHEVMDNNLKMPKITAIYLGCQISNKNKELLIEIAKENSIKLFQAERKYNSQKLVFKKLNNCI
jgi:hypothetical protein